MKVKKTALSPAALIFGIIFAAYVPLSAGQSVLFAAGADHSSHENVEKAHGHEDDHEDAAHSHAEPPSAVEKDAHGHEHAKPGRAKPGAAAKRDRQRDEQTGSPHAEPPSAVKKDEHGHGHAKPKPGRTDPHTAVKKDEHGSDEHEEEQVVHLTETEMKQFGIEVAIARPGNLENELSLPGEVAVNADRLTHIVPRIPGVVKEVRKRLGDTVKKGEIMAVIESRELADSKAEYLAAVERVKLAQSRYDRERRLWSKKISAEQEYLDAKQALAEQRIALRTAEQKLYALGLSTRHVKELPTHSERSLTRYEITAPFDSTVIEKHISMGELLKDESEPFAVADLSSVWVNLNIYQKDIGRVRQGQRVLINLGQGGNETVGKIDYVEPIVKGDTRTAIARVIVPNPDGIWHPGMFVTARVLTDDARAPVVVSPAAVQSLGEQKVVFVKTEDGFEPRHIRTGRANESGIEVVSGLSPGEIYANKGTLTLKAQLSKSEFGGHSH